MPKHRSGNTKQGKHTLVMGVMLASVAIGLFLISHIFLSNRPAVNTKGVAHIGTSHCSSNQAGQLVRVSISLRHMWACDAGKQVYDAPVVTGMEMYAADLTPVGTYHVYTKETDQDLTGCDSTGCWNDHVHYWLPWLQNQYGVYGFHDATWRPVSAFGNISPNSKNASHGCVELPLAAARWLYEWAAVGLTVTIES